MWGETRSVIPALRRGYDGSGKRGYDAGAVPKRLTPQPASIAAWSTQEERTELLTLYEAERRFSEIDRRFDGVDQRFTDANQRFQSIDTQLIDLRQGQRALDGKIDNLDKKLDGKISELDRKFNELDQKLDRRFGELDQKIDRKVNDLEGKISALDRKFEGKIDALDRKFEGKFDVLDGKIDALNDRITSSEERVRHEQRWLFGITLTIMIALFGIVIAIVA